MSERTLEDRKQEAAEAAERLGLTVEAMRAAGLRGLLLVDAMDEAARWLNEPQGLVLGQRGNVYLVGILLDSGAA